MRFLKQSTAIEVKVGPFVDSTDGFTAETGLTITQSEVLLAKEAGDWAQKNEATSLVHESNGWYRCLLDATDTNTVGTLLLQVAESGALPVWVEFTVLAANVYDSLIGATDALQVHTNEITAALITSTVLADNAITAAKINADAITAAKVAADVSAEIADAVWDEAASGHVAAGSFGEQCGTDIDAILVDTGTTLQGEVDGIQADTEDIQSRLPAALVSGRIDASVGAMAADVLTATAIAADAITAAKIADGAIDAGALAADCITAAKVAADVHAEAADAVWDEAAAGHVAAGSFGVQCGTDIDSILEDTGTTLQAEVDGIQADTEDIQSRIPASLVSGRIDASVGAMAANTLNASALASDAVTEIQSGLATSVPTANENADALLDRASAIDGYTVRQIMRVLAAALAGETSGGASDDSVMAIDGSKARITVTVDANGHRTDVTVDAT